MVHVGKTWLAEYQYWRDLVPLAGRHTLLASASWRRTRQDLIALNDQHISVREGRDLVLVPYLGGFIQPSRPCGKAAQALRLVVRCAYSKPMGGLANDRRLSKDCAGNTARCP